MDDAEFLAHATEIVNDLETELSRVKLEERGRWRALEIGCGSGLLMRPMSRHFLEIHGIDPSPVRLEQARSHLRDVPNARIPDAGGEDRPLVHSALEPFDFIYSLDAGFQALPWLKGALREGALARLRFDGIEHTRQDLLEFAAQHDFQVLAIHGTGTRSMWTTWKKRPSDWFRSAAKIPAGYGRIRRVTNASSNEPVAPSRGRFASICIAVDDLPAEAGLHHLRVTVGDSFGTVTSVGAAGRGTGRLVLADLPELEETGLLPVRLFWGDEPISLPHTLRVIPPGPSVPRILHVGRGVNTRTVRLTIEEIARPYDLDVTIGGQAVMDLEYRCLDPRPQRFDVTFHLPEDVGPGLHHINIALGRRKLPPVPLQVH